MAEIVGLSLLLSLFDAMSRTALVAGTGAVLAASAGVWLLAGAPRLPALPGNAPRSQAPPWPLLLVAAGVVVSLAYVVVLIAGTPPNGWDQLNYHLARAALWVQEQRVGYVGDVYDERINFFPPNGEIPVAFVLGVTRQEVLAALVQLTAALASASGVFALSRRFGFEPREAAFGALLYLTLPIVLLQSTTTKNDLVVASLLIGATVFLLGDSRREIALASVAVALAVGTKFTAAYGVAVLLAFAVLATPRALRTTRIAALGIGALAGTYWYGVNLAETGLLLGDQSNIPGLTAPLRPPENVLAAFGLLVDWVDLSGSEGRDVLLYAVAALAVATGLLAAGRGTNRGSALLAALLVTSPLILLVLSTEVGRPSLLWLHDVLGEPQSYLAEGGDVYSSPRTASDTGSWFGPAGLLLAAGVGAAGVVLVRRRSLPITAGVAAVAPLAWLVLVALTLTYHPWQGRFFLSDGALRGSVGPRSPPIRPGLERRGARRDDRIPRPRPLRREALRGPTSRPGRDGVDLGARALAGAVAARPGTGVRLPVPGRDGPGRGHGRARTRCERLRLPGVRPEVAAPNRARAVRVGRGRDRRGLARREPGSRSRDRPDVLARDTRKRGRERLRAGAGLRSAVLRGVSRPALDARALERAHHVVGTGTSRGAGYSTDGVSTVWSPARRTSQTEAATAGRKATAEM